MQVHANVSLSLSLSLSLSPSLSLSLYLCCICITVWMLCVGASVAHTNTRAVLCSTNPVSHVKFGRYDVTPPRDTVCDSGDTSHPGACPRDQLVVPSTHNATRRCAHNGPRFGEYVAPVATRCVFFLVKFSEGKISPKRKSVCVNKGR